MSDPSSHAVRHPSPHRGAVAGALLATAILAGPAAWALQLLVNYGLASMACYPVGQPHLDLPPAWRGLPHGLLAGSLAALAVAVVAAIMGYVFWRRTKGDASGGKRHLIEVGEGRTRFLSAWALWIGVLFSIALAFDVVGTLLVTSCGG
jgi:hypothetical protein